MRKKKGPTAVQRTETLSVRLDPKLRYLMELGARRQRRTLSSYMEWAVAESLSKVDITSSGKTIRDITDFIWDVNEVHRFLKLALNWPDLLNHDEQVLWKSLQENRFLWRGRRDSQGTFHWRPNSSFVILDRIEANWAALRAVANGSSKPDVLPKWKEELEPKALPFPHPMLDFYDEAADVSEPHNDDEPTQRGSNK